MASRFQSAVSGNFHPAGQTFFAAFHVYNLPYFLQLYELFS